MSDDGFQRITFHGRSSDDPRVWWANDDDGVYRVVPADAIVIERDELPEVVASSSGALADVGGMSTVILPSVEEHRVVALRHLALAEHLAAHPPVDEAQVEALARMLRDHAPSKRGGATWDYASDQTEWLNTARELIRAGWHRSADKHELEES